MIYKSKWKRYFISGDYNYLIFSKRSRDFTFLFDAYRCKISKFVFHVLLATNFRYHLMDRVSLPLGIESSSHLDAFIRIHPGRINIEWKSQFARHSDLFSFAASCLLFKVAEEGKRPRCFIQHASAISSLSTQWIIRHDKTKYIINTCRSS